MSFSNTTGFTLKSTNADFTLRQKNVLDQLEVIEKDRKNAIRPDEQMDVDGDVNIGNNKKFQKSLTKQFKSKESIFKKPKLPAPKNYMNSIPGYIKSPHKWTKYSLEDVNDEDNSDESCKKVALSFLNELKKRRTVVHPEEKLSDVSTKIIFQKHILSNKPNEFVDKAVPKSSFDKSKSVMPEYVVGQKKRKERKTKNMIQQSRKELKLDHLLEEED